MRVTGTNLEAERGLLSTPGLPMQNLTAGLGWPLPSTLKRVPRTRRI